LLKKISSEIDNNILFSVALTNGEYINIDSDNWSVLNIEGLLSSRYYNETWHVECLQAHILENSRKMSIIGENLCKYLGFTYVWFSINVQPFNKSLIFKLVV